MISLEVWRVMSGAESTLGVLYQTGETRRPLCWTLEDEFRLNKLPGETRIPPGTYPLALRTEGGFHERYAVRYGQLHRGMLWLRDVPGFEYVLIHCGNTDLDTAGCILVGDVARQNITGRGELQNSDAAYRRVYPLIAAWLENGHEVKLRLTDVDSPA